MTINELKYLLSRWHIKPDKRLGQNFLLSEEILDKIVDSAQLSKDDTVLEIGPGLGFLTKRLAEKAGQVVAVEKDRKLAKVLRKIFSTPSYISPLSRGRKRGGGNVKIVEGDALRLSPSVIPAFEPESSSNDKEMDSRLRGNDKVESGNDKPRNYKLVANIPYYLTGKILEKFLSATSLPTSPHLLGRGAGKKDPSPGDGEGKRERSILRPSLLVLLLQKEVAERIVAKPGDMSVLAVSVQFYADPEIIKIVPKENFYPMPEVDSAIVRIKVLPRPRFAPSLYPSPPAGEGRERGIDEKKFFHLVKIGFSNKRKQLHNNLRGLTINFNEFRERSEHISTSAKKYDRNEIDINGNSSHDYKYLLRSIGLNPLARAQDLSLEDWEKLYRKIF